MSKSIFGKTLLVAVLLLVCLPLTAHAEGKTVLFCNRKGTTIRLAIGWMDYGFPEASGWWEFNINDCRRISIPKADSILPLFAYVEDLDGNGWIPSGNGTNNFCVNRANNFEAKSTTKCVLFDEAGKQIVSDWQQFGALGSPLAEYYRWELH